MLPAMELPLFVIELATATPMYAGTVSTGDELLPGDVDHVPPQTGVGALSPSAKPLNDDGAPPVTLFFPAHWAPQKVTVDGAPLTVWLPRTKTPRLGNAKT